MQSVRTSPAPKATAAKILSKEAQALIRLYVTKFKDLSAPLPGTAELQQQTLQAALWQIASRGTVSEIQVILPLIENIAAQGLTTKRTALHWAALGRNWRCYEALESYARNTLSRNAGTLLPDRNGQIPAQYWTSDYLNSLKDLGFETSRFRTSVDSALLALRLSSAGTKREHTERKQAAAAEPSIPAMLERAQPLSDKEAQRLLEIAKAQAVNESRDSILASQRHSEMKAASPDLTAHPQAAPKREKDKESFGLREFIQLQQVAATLAPILIGILEIKIAELKTRSLSANAILRDVFAETRTSGQRSAPSEDEIAQLVGNKLSDMMDTLNQDVIKTLFLHCSNEDGKAFLETFLANGGAIKIQDFSKDVLKYAVPTATSPDIQRISDEIVSMVKGEKQRLAEEEALQREMNSLKLD